MKKKGIIKREKKDTRKKAQKENKKRKREKEEKKKTVPSCCSMSVLIVFSKLAVACWMNSSVHILFSPPPCDTAAPTPKAAIAEAKSALGASALGFAGGGLLKSCIASAG